MSDRTRIFICYKKRNSEGREVNAAFQLYQFLSENPEYEVWMDEGLDAGLLWEKTIYENLIVSHVLILAVGDGTSASEWVRRELSIAMAFNIQIIPVGLSITEAQLHQELTKLGLTGIHYKRPFNMASQTARAITSELAPALKKAREQTDLGEYALISKISERIKRRNRPAKPNMSAASKAFSVANQEIKIHIASGDIFRLSGYDVLVNSENDYMQMARIFDMASLSSNIRHFGSSTENGFLEDTIQLEIEKAMAGRPRPVPSGTAITTSSGGPSSSLFRNNKVSHIVHLAAVQAVIAEQRIAPLRSERQIRDCIAAALVAVQELCKVRGVISPPGSSQRRLQETVANDFAPKRIVLPLFGTGRGGQSPLEVGPIVLSAVLDFFSASPFQDLQMPVSDVHISVYSDEDVRVMAEVLAKM
jgi:O-acetyl-ADP-ribose deacetylase (regulator of RNase III)